MKLRTLNFLTGKKGAFLIEALIAVAILGVSLVLIIQSYLSSLRGALFTEDHTIAMFLLENKVSEFKLGAAKELQHEENFPQPFERFTFTSKASEIKEDDKPGILNNVRLVVHWPSGKKKNELETETYVFKSE